MERLYSCLIVIVALVLFAGLSGTAEAIDLRSWDQKIANPGTRFKLKFDGTAVLDNETQLLWEQNPIDTARAWLAAHTHCNQKTVGDRKGWRLPTIQELASLVDPGNLSPALPVGHPFTLTSVQEGSSFWSATTLANNAGFAWDVFLLDGVVDSSDKLQTDFVWCVRGGQGVDPQ